MVQSLLLPIAKAKDEIAVLAGMANRHGLIAGATGTGKTVTLRVLAEQFSRIGVPVFLADIKGDLSGLPLPGGDNPKVVERAEQLGLAGFAFEGSPVVFWDVFGEQGHPLRTTISEMGPLLLSRILNLNETQSGVLNITFKLADDHGLLLLDLKDLQAMIQFVGDKAERVHDAIREYLQGQCRGHSAGAADPGAGGRRSVFRRTGPEYPGLYPDRWVRQRGHQCY